MTPKTFPSSEASPPVGALRSTSATPPNASNANTSARRLMYSRKTQAPTGTIRNGAHDPISAAFATLLCVAPAKNTARFSPKNTPGIHTARTSRSVTRRPVLQRTTFHARLTVTSRQNATSTPAVSARFTNVELSENATTNPRTASTPTVFALSPRTQTGARAACETALIRSHYGVLGPSTTARPERQPRRKDCDERSEASAAPVHARDRGAEGAGRRGRLEQPRPRKGRAGVHRRLGLAQPRPLRQGARRDHRLPDPEVGARARLRTAQEPLVLRHRPHRGALPVRKPRKRRPMVAQLRQRALGIRRERSHAPTRSKHQRRADR